MLYQKILNKLDEERGLSDELAILAGYKSGQALRKALRENREFGSFQGLINLVKELFPNDEMKLIAEYAKELDPNKQTARYMLEYLNLHKQFDTLRALIDNMLVCGNSTSKEWATVYNIEQMTNDGEITLLEALNLFGKINPKSIEMIACNEIMKSYCYLLEKDFRFAYHHVISLEELIGQINELYIKDIFLGRTMLIISEYYYLNDEIEKARFYQERIIREINDNRLKSLTYLHKGNSLIIESYEEAMNCFKKGLEIADGHKSIVTGIKRSINFTCNFWGKSPLYLDLDSKEPTDIHEVVFSKINNEQYVEATELLNTINIAKLNFNTLGFHYYLRGLISKNEDDFCNSVYNFKTSSDLHFIKLPLIELKKKGYSEMVIKCMLA